MSYFEIGTLILSGLAISVLIYFPVKMYKLKKADVKTEKKEKCTTEMIVMKKDVKDNANDIESLIKEVKENKNGSVNKEELTKEIDRVIGKINDSGYVQDVKFDGLRKVVELHTKNIMEAIKGSNTYIHNVEKKIDEHLKEKH